MTLSLEHIQPVAMSTEQAASYIGLSVEYLKRARITGGGPAYSKIGRRVVYQIEDLRKFLNQHRQINNSIQKSQGE